MAYFACILGDLREQWFDACEYFCLQLANLAECIRSCIFTPSQDGKSCVAGPAGPQTCGKRGRGMTRDPSTARYAIVMSPE